MAEIFLQKSNNNIEVAKYLFNKKKYYQTVVHCSYYSIFQAIIYVLRYILLRDENSINNESKNTHESMHITCIKNIYRDLYEYDADKATDFNDFIGELKDLRNDSDYKEREIEQPDGLKAITLANQISNILKEKYKI